MNIDEDFVLYFGWYYFPPSSEQKFNSMAGVLRYLDTTQIKASFERISNNDIVLKGIAEELSSGTMKKTGTTTTEETIRSDSSADETMKSTLSISSSQNSDQKKGKIGLAESSIVSCCIDEDVQEKQFQENSETKHETETSKARIHKLKKKHKSVNNFPRRTSKRLAGIMVDQLQELKTSRTRRDVVKQLEEEETKFNSLCNDRAKPANDASKTKFNANSIQNTMKNNSASTEEECVSILENVDNIDAKLDYNCDFPLKEILTDPCIAFAIQTLTGVTFETSKDIQTFEERGKKIDVTHEDSEGRSVLSSPEKFAITQEHSVVAKVNDKANKKHDISKMALSSSVCSQYFGTKIPMCNKSFSELS
uniref:Uncharacterized protein LOC105851262 isoform X3 n=1 Tax=Cicer arietinum TaxID=3827 RepID=A0A1S3DVX9_CICAR|nr:uncharacterized protein LOC105851262 isoform X3 [Cicer arietinum]